MRKILRVIFTVCVLIATPLIWLTSYAIVGSKEATEYCKDIIKLSWYGEN